MSRIRSVPPAGVFVLAAAIGAFDIGSYVWLRANSEDFVEAGGSRALSYALGDTIAWTGRAPAALKGWWRSDPSGAWSVAKEASLVIRLRSSPDRDLELQVLVAGFVEPHALPARQVEVLVNRTPVARWTLDTPDPVECIAHVPRPIVAESPIMRVDFRFGEERSPADLGLSADRRALGMRLIQWRLAPAPEGSAASLCRRPR